MMINIMDFLFPTPSPPPSTLSPQHWPGVSPQSTEALLKALRDNHTRWHTFVNEKRFHNHAPHRSLALWSLGTDGEIISAGYAKDCGYEKPAIKPPQQITKDNFVEHLGDEKFYGAYLAYFTQSLLDQGIAATLEEHLFSAKANVGENADSVPPRMLGRFFSGVVHPLIHTGYGAEFGLPGMIAEGLAQTAVHAPAAAALTPDSIFGESRFSILSSVAQSAGRALHHAFDSTIDNIDNALQQAMHIRNENVAARAPFGGGPEVNTEDHVPVRDVHALDILGWVAEDLRFAPALNPDQKNSFDGTIAKHAKTLLKFADLWNLDAARLGSDQVYQEGKLEELAWLVTVMYGVGGWSDSGTDGDFNADFFLMHMVTSSLFTPSLCAYISPVARARLLHTYLVVALAMYVFRGCPSLDLVGFSKLRTVPPSGPQPHPSKDTLPSPHSMKATNPDPWLPLLQTSIVHPDEHLTKTQRSLSNWASHFGTRTFTSSENRKLAAPASFGKPSDPDHGEAAAGLGMGWGIGVPVSKASGAAQLGRLGQDRPIPLELAGAEYLDGTLFLKTAELTAKRLGRVREGENTGRFWDFKGFYNKDETKARL